MLSSPEDECDSWNTHTSPKTSTPLRGSPMWAIHRTEGLHKKLGHGDRAHTLVEEERDRKIPILSAAKKKKETRERCGIMLLRAWLGCGDRGQRISRPFRGWRNYTLLTAKFIPKIDGDASATPHALALTSEPSRSLSFPAAFSCSSSVAMAMAMGDGGGGGAVGKGSSNIRSIR